PRTTPWLANVHVTAATQTPVSLTFAIEIEPGPAAVRDLLACVGSDLELSRALTRPDLLDDRGADRPLVGVRRCKMTRPDGGSKRWHGTVFFERFGVVD